MGDGVKHLSCSPSNTRWCRPSGMACSTKRRFYPENRRAISARAGRQRRVGSHFDAARPCQRVPLSLLARDHATALSLPRGASALRAPVELRARRPLIAPLETDVSHASRFHGTVFAALRYLRCARRFDLMGDHAELRGPFGTRSWTQAGNDTPIFSSGASTA